MPGRALSFVLSPISIEMATDDYAHGRREFMVSVLPRVGTQDVGKTMKEAAAMFGAGASLFPDYRLTDNTPHVWYIYTHSFSAPMVRDELERRLPGAQIFVGELRQIDPDQPPAYAWVGIDPMVMDKLGKAAYKFDGEPFPRELPG